MSKRKKSLGDGSSLEKNSSRPITKNKDIDAEANEILKQELKEKWIEKTYDDIRLDPYSYGFASTYLCLSANYKEFSSSAEISTLIKLAKLDLEKGTTICELVFSCCKWIPKKAAIQSMIELGIQNENEKKVVESVLEFQDHHASSCLTIIFDMASQRYNDDFQYPSAPMLRYIEESCLYMIELARSSNLDLEKILNHTTRTGDTLFFNASIFSEEITKRLLLEPVRLNSINHTFGTAFFRVRLEVCFC